VEKGSEKYKEDAENREVARPPKFLPLAPLCIFFEKENTMAKILEGK
jgi:hypothetical protein